MNRSMNTRPLIACFALLGALAAPCSLAQPLELATYDYPPFMEEGNNGPQGMAIDIVKAVFKRMRVETHFQFFPTQRALMMMDTGKADAILTIKKTDQREAAFHFPSEPLFTQQFVIFTAKGSPLRFKGDLADLAQISIGIVSNASYGPRFDAAVSSQALHRLEPANDFEQNFKKLIAHRMEAVISSRAMGIAVLHKLGALDQIEVNGPPVEELPSYLAFQRTPANKKLSVRFDETLRAMKEDGSLTRILKRYRSLG